MLFKSADANAPHSHRLDIKVIWLGDIGMFLKLPPL